MLFLTIFRPIVGEEGERGGGGRRDQEISRAVGSRRAMTPKREVAAVSVCPWAVAAVLEGEVDQVLPWVEEEAITMDAR